MRLLVDTHTFLWFVTNDPLLSSTALQSISNGSNDVLISPVSYWEVAIKVGLGKYPLAASFGDFFEKGISENGFQILNLEISHAAILASLPHHHKDPFDRMIVSQAIAEQIPVVSADKAMDAYGIVRIW